MHHRNREPSTREKEQTRSEIEDQVAAFLARGGKIDVVNDQKSADRKLGSYWQGTDDPLALLD